VDYQTAKIKEETAFANVLPSTNRHWQQGPHPWSGWVEVFAIFSGIRNRRTMNRCYRHEMEL